MTITLSEAATLLGKSERQLRYMIKSGSLIATKVDGKWAIEESNLPLTAVQRTALADRVDAARQAFDKAVAPAAAVAEKRERQPYSVTKLLAFQRGEALYRDVREQLGREAAGDLLFAALEALVLGCHSFRPEDKARNFVQARSRAATALTHLLLGDPRSSARAELATRLEAEVLPRISGLIAACEKRSRRRRLDHYGALRQTITESRAR